MTQATQERSQAENKEGDIARVPARATMKEPTITDQVPRAGNETWRCGSDAWSTHASSATTAPGSQVQPSAQHGTRSENEQREQQVRSESSGSWFADTEELNEAYRSGSRQPEADVDRLRKENRKLEGELAHVTRLLEMAEPYIGGCQRCHCRCPCHDEEPVVEPRRMASDLGERSPSPQEPIRAAYRNMQPTVETASPSSMESRSSRSLPEGVILENRRTRQNLQRQGE